MKIEDYKLATFLFKDENLHEVHSLIEADHECSDLKLKETFDCLQQGIQIQVV